VRELRDLPNADQIWAIDRAIELGAYISEVKRQNSYEGGSDIWIVRLTDQAGDDAEWTCGPTAGQHALEKLQGS
jgi:hypothetical protein